MIHYEIVKCNLNKSCGLEEEYYEIHKVYFWFYRANVAIISESNYTNCDYIYRANLQDLFTKIMSSKLKVLSIIPVDSDSNYNSYTKTKYKFKSAKELIEKYTEEFI